MKTRVILVDDHALTLIGMRYLLSAYDDLRIVAQAQDADGLLAQLEAHPCDLLITDLMMPGSQQADGLRLVQKVRRRYPDLPIIVVTMLGNPALVSSLLKLGIHGLVSKRGMLDDLPKAIRHAGRRPFISRSIAHLLEVGEAEHGKPLASLEQLTCNGQRVASRPRGMSRPRIMMEEPLAFRPTRWGQGLRADDSVPMGGRLAVGLVLSTGFGRGRRGAWVRRALREDGPAAVSGRHNERSLPVTGGFAAVAAFAFLRLFLAAAEQWLGDQGFGLVRPLAFLCHGIGPRR